MDFVRGVCILLVIFGHASYVTRNIANLTYSHGFVFINSFMDPFRIPLLMFLSGMLLQNSLAKNSRQYIWGKFCLIFWPFLFWSILTYAAENRLTLEYLIKTPFSAPSVLWYLWFLCAFYIVSLALDRYSIPLVPIVIVCIFSSGFLPSLLRMDRFAALLAFFLAGHIVSRQKITHSITLPVAIVGLGAGIVGGIISVHGYPIKYNPLFLWAPAGLITFTLWASSLFKSTIFSSPFEWIGRNAIVFYAAHFPVLVVSSNFAAQKAEWNGSVFCTILFLWAILLGTLLQFLRGQYVIFAALFDFQVIIDFVKSVKAFAKS